MSMIICSQDDLGRVNRRVWGRIFGLFIRKGREKKGYSVEDVAGLAGLEPSAWAAFETGRVPEPAPLSSATCNWRPCSSCVGMPGRPDPAPPPPRTVRG